VAVTIENKNDSIFPGTRVRVASGGPFFFNGSSGRHARAEKIFFFVTSTPKRPEAFDSFQPMNSNGWWFGHLGILHLVGP
jgi:hypothetical protein